MKYLIILGTIILLIPCVSAQIYVPDNYPYIQWAVNNASEGDTIIVRDGFYNEYVHVLKSVTITSQNGSANCKVGGFYVDADGVTIDGFTINGSMYGVYIDGVESCGVYDMVIECSEYGIFIKNSMLCEIYNNTFLGNTYGILLNSSTENSITDNEFVGNDHSIFLNNSSDNNIFGNYFERSKYYSILCKRSDSNYIEGNEFFRDNISVMLKSSNYLSIDDNIFTNCNYSLHLTDSSYSEIYLNDFMDGPVYSSNSTNHWNTTVAYLYEYKGNQYVNYIGNHWSDYTGSDDNGDGIGDTPYTIDQHNVDHHPLIDSKDNYAIKFEASPTPTPTVSVPEYPAFASITATVCILFVAARLLRIF